MSENYRQAPRLIHKGKKFVNHSDVFWSLPQVLMSNVFAELNGKCGNQIKLMCLLIGTLGDGSFRVSEKWVMEQTGMDETGYKRARAELIKRGWLIHKDGALCVDFDRIWANGPKLHSYEYGNASGYITEVSGPADGTLVASKSSLVASGSPLVASSPNPASSCF